MKISVGNLLSAISHLIDIAQGRREHAPKVTYISLQLSNLLGLKPVEKKKIYYAAFFHDIGITVADKNSLHPILTQILPKTTVYLAMNYCKNFL